MISKQHREPALDVVLWLVLTFACLGVISSVMWYVKAQEVATLKRHSDKQTTIITVMAVDVARKRHKIDQANRLLSVAYPGAKMDFLSGD